MKNTIQKIITYLVENRSELSKSKFSGVNFVEDYMGTGESFYRVHKGAFIPTLFSLDSNCNDAIADVVARTEFKCDVVWDAPSLWLTISK